MAATIRNKIEKQITRMYEDGVERAVSVVSKDVVHLPGNVLSKNDIMFNPGKNVIDIIKVYDNLVAITPYSILLKSGNGNQHNTKEYKLDYSMMGNYHYICHDNKNTIMHAAYDNNVVQFIKLLPDGGIKEINVAPAPGETIINACCIHQFTGKYCWWVFTTDNIYYCKDYDFETWDKFAYDMREYANEIKEQKALVNYYYDSASPQTIGNTFFVSFKVNNINLLRFNSAGIIGTNKYPYPSAGGIKENALCPGCLLMSDIGIYTTNISTKTGSYSRITEFYNDEGVLYIRVLNPNPDITQQDTVYINNKSLGLSVSDNDLFMYFPGEWTESTQILYRLGQLYIFKYNEDTEKINPNGISYKIRNANGTTPTATEAYKVELRNSDFKLFNTMPSNIFTMTRRDVGDEVFCTTKAVYYNNGTTEFYIKNKMASGFLYRYLDTTVNATNNEVVELEERDTNSDIYQMRRKINVTSKFENIKDDNETTGTYTGNGANARVFDFSTKNKIPKFIFIKDISSSTVNNKYGWAYLLPKENYGIVQAGTFTGPHIKLIDDGSATASFKVDESTYTVQIQFNGSGTTAGSCFVNMTGHTYRWYAKF